MPTYPQAYCDALNNYLVTVGFTKACEWPSGSYGPEYPATQAQEYAKPVTPYQPARTRRIAPSGARPRLIMVK